MPSLLSCRMRSGCSAVVILIALSQVVAGCGIALRAPQAMDTSTNTVASQMDPSMSTTPVMPPVSIDPLTLAPGQTVVSLTFDDGRASQLAAARMLSEHGLSATFFVNSGTIGNPGQMSLDDLRTVASSGNEIAGHTVTHPDILHLPGDELRRQICDDRTTLLGWGFAVRNFAYPFGAATPEIENVVRECGYNSARNLGGLRPIRPTEGVPADRSCQLCDVTEAVPPEDPMFVQAISQVTNTWTAAELEQAVTRAMAVGGWLPLTFHELCTDKCTTLGLPESQFEEFVTWLAAKEAEGTVLVRTVGGVIGGTVAPAVAGPAVSPSPVGVNGVTNPGLEQNVDGTATCWMRGGFGNNKPEFSLVPSTHGGMTASRLIMRDYIDGDAKLLQTTDLGECAPAVVAGQTYTIEAWYTATVPTSFSVQYRLARGGWGYAMSSPTFAAATDFSRAQWTLPPIPQGVTGISFGLSLSQDGELVTDDYSLILASPADNPHP